MSRSGRKATAKSDSRDLITEAKPDPSDRDSPPQPSLTIQSQLEDVFDHLLELRQEVRELKQKLETSIRETDYRDQHRSRVIAALDQFGPILIKGVTPTTGKPCLRCSARAICDWACLRMPGHLWQ